MARVFINHVNHLLEGYLVEQLLSHNVQAEYKKNHVDQQVNDAAPIMVETRTEEVLSTDETLHEQSNSIPLKRYRIMGTLSSQERFSVDHLMEYVSFVPQKDHKLLKQSLLDSDIVIYRLFQESDIEEVHYALNLIESASIGSQVFILVSSVATWSNTTRFMQEDNTYEPYHEESAITRQALPKFQKLLDLEKRVRRMNTDFLRTFVVCSGILYGEGEEYLHQFFQMASSLDCEKLPCFLNGDNFLPLVHVHDVSNVIRFIMDRVNTEYESQITQKYVLAIDDSRITLRELLSSLNKAYGGEEEVEHLTADEMLLYDHVDYLTLDMKFTTVTVKSWGIQFEYTSGLLSHMASVSEKYEKRGCTFPLREAFSSSPLSLKTMRMIAERVGTEQRDQFIHRLQEETEEVDPESLLRFLAHLITDKESQSHNPNPVEQPIEQVYARIAEFIGLPASNYIEEVLTEEEMERRQEKERLRLEMERVELERRENMERLELERQLEEERVDEIHREENEVLKVRSKPLQRYLLDSVVPTVMRGLVDVALLRPDDPVSHLARYLQQHNPMKDASRDHLAD